MGVRGGGSEVGGSEVGGQRWGGSEVGGQRWGGSEVGGSEVGGSEVGGVRGGGGGGQSTSTGRREPTHCPFRAAAAALLGMALCSKQLMGPVLGHV